MVKIVIFSLALFAAVFAEPHVHPVGYRDAVIYPSQFQDVYPYPYQAPTVQKVGLGVYEKDYGVVSATTDVATQKLSLGYSLLSTAISFVSSGAFEVAKTVAVFIFANLPKLLIGGMVAIGICKLTPICTKLSHFTSVEEVVSFATPERITRAAKFVEKAIEKYSAMQNVKAL